jgi:hypothetical protein
VVICRLRTERHRLRVVIGSREETKEYFKCKIRTKVASRTKAASRAINRTRSPASSRRRSPDRAVRATSPASRARLRSRRARHFSGEAPLRRGFFCVDSGGGHIRTRSRQHAPQRRRRVARRGPRRSARQPLLGRLKQVDPSSGTFSRST